MDKDYFFRKHVPHLTKEICENSIYEYIEGELGLSISYAQKEIVAEPCTDFTNFFRQVRDMLSEKVILVQNHMFPVNLSRPDDFPDVVIQIGPELFLDQL